MENERYVIGKDFNAKDWFVYDDETDTIICRCDTEEEAIEFVKNKQKRGKYMNDNELREWCISNYGSELAQNCDECPYRNECDDFIERHNGNTPLFG